MLRGVTVIVAVISVLPGLVAVNCGTLPVPDAAKPIAVFELVQVTVAPEGVIVKLVAGTNAPSFTVIFAGTVTVGQTLTATYDYTDVENGTDASTFIWYRSNTALGAGKVTISGATAKTYTLVTADLGKYVSVRITPNDGISPGTNQESARLVVLAGTLPVKLSFFKGKEIAGGIQLSWQTSSEINSLYFGIEHSVDGRAWETVGKVNAAGDSFLPIAYSHIDEAPATGRNLYRLRTVDRDGHTELSNIIQVDLALNNLALSVYPIPAINSITVKAVTGNKPLNYIINDVEGKKVKTGVLTKPEQQIEIPELKKGVYFLQVENRDAVRFIKQ